MPKLVRTFSTFEVGEVIEAHPKRVEGQWEVVSNVYQPLDHWRLRARNIRGAIENTTKIKIAETYPLTNSALILYLNIGEWGERQLEIEEGVHSATENARHGIPRNLDSLERSKISSLAKMGLDSSFINRTPFNRQ